MCAGVFFCLCSYRLMRIGEGSMDSVGMVLGMKNHRRPEKLMTAGGNINRDRTGLA